jgi:hypothetical protein
MAPPYLYRTCRLIQMGGSHVQQSAPSHHITLDSNDLIHAQCKQDVTPALPGFPHPTGVNRDRERLTKGRRGISTIELSRFEQAKLTVATGGGEHTPGGMPILLTLC